MIYLSKGGAGADSDHTWIRPWLCEFVGNCFGPRYFSLGVTLPQKNTLAQNNHLRFSHNDLKKDDAQLLLSKS